MQETLFAPVEPPEEARVGYFFDRVFPCLAGRHSNRMVFVTGERLESSQGPPFTGGVLIPGCLSNQLPGVRPSVLSAILFPYGGSMAANRVGIDFSQAYFDLLIADSNGKPITPVQRFSHDGCNSEKQAH